MNKEFVPYEIAIKLKQNSFNEACLAAWVYKNKEKDTKLIGCGALHFEVDGLPNNTDYEDILCSAPLYQQVFKWFRKEHELYGYPEEFFIDGTQSFSYIVDGKTKYKSMDWFESYEDAELGCIIKLIDIINGKGL